jgi:lipoprotein
MKKVVFSMVLVLTTVIAFTSCKQETDWKKNIVKNANYKGTEVDGTVWEATFTETSFTATTKGITVTATSWDVVTDANNPKVAGLTFKGAKIKTDKEEKDLQMLTGAASENGKKIIITSGKIIITFEKK